MVFTAARMINRSIDKQDQMKLMEKTYPLITINLREEVSFLQKINFKEPSMHFLNADEWFSISRIIDEYDMEILSKIKWYDMGLFVLSVFPITTRQYGGNVFLRFITLGKNIPQSYTFQIYLTTDAEVLLPGFTTKTKSKFLVSPNKLVIKDIPVDIISFSLKEYFTMLFGTGDKVLRLRVKIIVESKQKLAKTYQEIKNSRFYNLVEMPYVTPGGSQRIIHRIHLREKLRLKEKKAVLLKLDKIQKGELDQDWITDFNELSKFWSKD